MAGGSQGDVEIAELCALPGLQLDDLAEPAAFHHAADTFWHNDGLTPGDAAQAGQMEVIKVGVRDEHEIDGWKVAGPEAGVAEARHGAVPERPVRVDDHIHAADLGEETRMA